MSNRPIGQLTLREMCRDAEQKVRDLTDHLEQAFVQQAHQLRKVTRAGDATGDAPVADVTVRNQVARVLESEQYLSGLYDDCDRYLKGIRQEFERGGA